MKNILRSNSPFGVIRRLPINYAGKLQIPTPWSECMPDNKVHWKERAIKGKISRFCETAKSLVFR